MHSKFWQTSELNKVKIYMQMSEHLNDSAFKIIKSLGVGHGVREEF